MGLVNKIKQAWGIEELKNRILNTLLFLLVYRLGSFVIIPGVDSGKLKNTEPEGVVELINQFTGGAFSSASIFALGIMPYITASIVIQLLGMAVPKFQKLQKEGESGRKKMQTYTKFLTILVVAIQAPGYLTTQISDDAILFSKSLFFFSSITIMIASTMFIMWLGDKITEKGIGNGVSLLIAVGIISNLPTAIFEEITSRMSEPTGRLLIVVLELVVWFFVILFSILVIKGVRKIALEYPKQMILSGGINKVQTGGRNYLPLKVAMAGVMPIIFAQAIMFLPQTLANSSFLGVGVKSFFIEISKPDSIWYNVTTALLIIVFTYFYTAMIVNPRQWADDFKRQGAYIPGVKPGNDTAEYIDNIMGKITFPGSLFLALIAILPIFAIMFGVKQKFAYFFGGTSLLIMVGVVLDTMQQINSFLLNRNYEGFMKEGRLRDVNPAGDSSLM